MLNLPVLVLNQNYEPLNICRTPRALMLIYRGKAEMLENGVGFVHTASLVFPLPSVIKLIYQIKRPRPEPKLNRLEIFDRDRYTCQYCGKETRELTIDHVVPRRQGGPHSWENLVSACIPCNRRKAGRTPEQASMKLIRRPQKPRSNGHFGIPRQYREARADWRKYLPQS
ncbi:MAG: HNH endonuclease [Chloroflexota bacterium]